MTTVTSILYSCPLDVILCTRYFIVKVTCAFLHRIPRLIMFKPVIGNIERAVHLDFWNVT